MYFMIGQIIGINLVLLRSSLIKDDVDEILLPFVVEMVIPGRGDQSLSLLFVVYFIICLAARLNFVLGSNPRPSWSTSQPSLILLGFLLYDGVLSEKSVGLVPSSFGRLGCLRPLPALLSMPPIIRIGGHSHLLFFHGLLQ